MRKPQRRSSLVIALAALAAASAPASFAAPDPAGAKGLFDRAQSICQRDGGRLWGRSICGPMLVVDPADRAVVANVADPGGALVSSGGLFTGALPPSVVLANTPVDWSGARWTELLWPLQTKGVAEGVPGDAWVDVELAHELFHRIQSDVGFTRPEAVNDHLDTPQGRYLLQLEWRALARALSAAEPSARRQAAADAVLFRAERYRLFPEAAEHERSLEVDEGVPEWTGVRLGIAKPADRRRYAIYDLTAFVDAPSYVRSFAYATGPAYGLLLDEVDPSWRRELLAGRGFGDLLAAGFRLPPPDFGRLAARERAYDDGRLRASETKREAERQRRLSALEARLVDGPVLRLPLDDASYEFNPQTLVPLGAHGTVYPRMRLKDDWGLLVVESGGALVSRGEAVVSAISIDPSHLRGPGWELQLKSGWSVRPGLRVGDYRVVHADEALH
jgi:hypothetical protein